MKTFNIFYLLFVVVRNFDDNYQNILRKFLSLKRTDAMSDNLADLVDKVVSCEDLLALFEYIEREDLSKSVTFSKRGKPDIDI